MTNKNENIKKSSSTEENYKKRIKWLFNLLNSDNIENIKDYDINNYIIKINKDILFNFINNLEKSKSSKEALFLTISKYLRANTPEDINNIKKFTGAGVQLINEIQNNDEKNEIDEDKKAAYRDLNYFKDILKNYKHTKQLKNHYEYLLLSLLVNNPPLRTQLYSTAEIITTEPTNKENNYILLIDNKAYIIINKDKVSNNKDTKNKIEIINNDLINFLYKSFKLYPRRFLFELNDKPASPNTLRQYLRNISKIPSINFDIMRSIYITDKYKTTHQTLKSKKELSKDMRHSESIAARAYFKNTDTIQPNYNEENDKLKTAINLLILENNTLKEQIKLLLPTKTDKIFKKIKSDLLYTLNVKKAVGKPETLKKYNIIFDENLKKYI